MNIDNYSRINEQDPYQVLGVSRDASADQLKAAYRELVKKYHPDAGGDQKKILVLNAAWEILGDEDSRNKFDANNSNLVSLEFESEQRGVRNAEASASASAVKGRSREAKFEINFWSKKVYLPIDRLLGKIITPFSREIRALSADPYDDLLMETFVHYLDKSRGHIDKVIEIYRSIHVPSLAHSFGLNLYHCVSQVDDGISELERYTMGYVDNYLHDGKEMLREASKRRLALKEEHRFLENM